MCKIAICDDESIQLDILEETIYESGMFNSSDMVIDRFIRGADLIKAVKRGNFYSYIFLDINMPTKNGIETYEELEITVNTKVIFVSTHAEKIPDVSALRTPSFIYKPYDVNTFCKTLKVMDSQSIDEYIFHYIKDEKMYVISSKEISYIEVRNHDISANTATSVEIALRRISMDELSDILKPYGFFRCHRSFLVNLKYYDRHDASNIYLQGGNDLSCIPLSRKYKSMVAGTVLKYKMSGNVLGA